MINEERIRKLAEEKLGDSGLFLTSVLVKPGNSILVFIDGDHGVTIDDCVSLSRHIESSLDRDSEDFNLQVSSAGIDQPLQFPRQFVKNMGRRLSLSLHDGSTITGKLLLAGDDGIHIQTEEKKGRKIIPGKTQEFNYTEIAKALCLVSFKKEE